MNKAVLNPAVQEFIRSHLDVDLSRLILKGSPFPDVSAQELAVQISGMKKAAAKLPIWFETPHIYYPPQVNLEQTSSEITAKHKASIVNGKRLMDLTGGFGIDSYFFAESIERVVHCEVNSELSEIAAHNFEVLERNNIETYSGDGIIRLKDAQEKFDWLYIDPARRDDYGGKVFKLEQCTPDVLQHLKLFFSKADNVLIKTSPLLDLSAGINDLRKVVEVHVVAVNNEVKELLWILNREINGKIQVKTFNFLNNVLQFFEAEFGEQLPDAPLSLPQQFIYEPNPAIMKSGLFAALARKTNTSKLHSNSHIFTAAEQVNFPGRCFKLIKTFLYNKKELRRELKFTKANITTRNFPKSVAELRKEHKIEDGGDIYLFFTTNLKNQKIVLVCEKLKN